MDHQTSMQRVLFSRDCGEKHATSRLHSITRVDVAVRKSMQNRTMQMVYKCHFLPLLGL